ncbi:ACT domain-containing protein, partial [Candidatus Poribacteria bacterium]|nr:ACT domain-containing protein [Candidatus Poribacteria bacterium]
PIDDCKTRYYIRFQAFDKPGVLAKVTGILGDHGISISSVIQMGRKREGEIVPVVMMTHEALERDVQIALREIDALSVIKPNSMLIRVEAMEGEDGELGIV